MSLMRYGRAWGVIVVAIALAIALGYQVWDGVVEPIVSTVMGWL